MSAPAQEIGLDQWIEYCYSLRPIENFLLIGLLNRGKYSARDLAGDGTYTSAQASEYAPVFFELTYRPPIVEWVDDEAAYPLSVPKEHIWIPAEINGLMRVSGKRDVDEILFTFDPNGANRYVFVDRTSAQSVMGRPSNIVRSDKGQHVLGIVGDALEFGQDRPN